MDIVSSNRNVSPQSVEKLFWKRLWTCLNHTTELVNE